jgi:hypothetical protein
MLYVPISSCTGHAVQNHMLLWCAQCRTTRFTVFYCGQNHNMFCLSETQKHMHWVDRQIELMHWPCPGMLWS